jgi:hypothetical protein
VGNHEGLAIAPGAGARHLGQCRSDLPCHLPTDSLIHFVEHQRGNNVVLDQDDLQGEHQPGDLAARGDASERARIETFVQLHQERHGLCSITPRRGQRLKPRHELAAWHSQHRELLRDRPGQARCAALPFGRQGLMRTPEICLRCGPLSRDFPQVQVSSVEQIELVRGRIARCQHVRDGRPVLLEQTVQRVAPPLDLG